VKGQRSHAAARSLTESGQAGTGRRKRSCARPRSGACRGSIRTHPRLAGHCEREGHFTVIATARVTSPSLRARGASAGEAIQDGRVPAVDSGLLRRLRRLAMTVDIAVPQPPAHDSRYAPPRHCERERKRARSNPESDRATRSASRTEFVAPPAWIASAASPPRNDGRRCRRAARAPIPSDRTPR
jgi:hypothetical protein